MGAISSTNVSGDTSAAFELSFSFHRCSDACARSVCDRAPNFTITESADGGLTVVGSGSAYRFAYYTRHDGTSFSPLSKDSASVTLTEVDAPGGVVAGSYTASVVDSTEPDAGSLSLSGTFSACRVADGVGPTPANR